MSADNDFHQDMQKLFKMLKDLLKNRSIKEKIKEHQEKSPQDSVNINIFFLPLLSLSADELDEFEDMYDEYMIDEEKSLEDMTTDLTKSDMDFLRRNGIRF